MTDPGELDRRIYNDLRQLYIEDRSDEDDPDSVALEFDMFIGRLLNQGAQQANEQEIPELEVSRAQMMMEVILEIEQVVTMVPPRVKAYRDLLAAAGLDRAVEDAENAGDGSSGQKGLPGINLADQAALEFHSNILGMAFNLAQEEVMDRARRKQLAAGGEVPQ